MTKSDSCSHGWQRLVIVHWQQEVTSKTLNFDSSGIGGSKNPGNLIMSANLKYISNGTLFDVLLNSISLGAASQKRHKLIFSLKH